MTGGPAATAPPEDVGLAEVIPAVAGYDLSPASGMWNPNFTLPEDVVGVRRAVAGATLDGATLTVVAPQDERDYEAFEDEVVDTFFADPVDLVRDVDAMADGNIVLTTSVHGTWQPIAQEFVLEARLEDGAAARWQWFWGGFLWVVESPGEARVYVEALIEAQHSLLPPDEYDTHVIAGELIERFADLPDYTYIDLARPPLLELLPESIAGPCQNQLLAFGVTSEPDDVVIDEANLAVQMALLDSDCDEMADGYLDGARSEPGAREESVAGIQVVLTDKTVAFSEDGVVFWFESQGSDTVAAMRPFIDAFITYQADLPAEDA